MSLNQITRANSFTLTHAHIDPVWQWCSSPLSVYTAKQMVVCFTVQLHPDWFICLSVLVPSLVCLNSKLFGAALAVRVTTIAICWIILASLFLFKKKFCLSCWFFKFWGGNHSFLNYGCFVTRNKLIRVHKLVWWDFLKYIFCGFIILIIVYLTSCTKEEFFFFLVQLNT